MQIKNMWHIDRFPSLLTEKEANELLSPRFIKFDRNDKPSHEHAIRDLIEEEKYIKCFLDLFKHENYSIRFTEKLKMFRGRNRWMLNCLRKYERKRLKLLVKETKGKEIPNPDPEIIELLVKLSCRDLIFPEFILSKYTIMGSYEMIFVVHEAKKEDLQTLEDILARNGLFLRPALSEL